MKTLIIYFSASAQGVTKNVAVKAAEEAGADTFSITPEQPYTEADINWKNPLSRCNKEKFGKKDVPVSGTVENFANYELVCIGFPIWYGCAPNVVNTFCKGYDWTGKKVAVFATSGGSGIGKSAAKLAPYIQGADIVGDKLVKSGAELAEWIKEL